MGSKLEDWASHPLYMAWGLHEHRPNLCAILNPAQLYQPFCGSNLVTCKVMRPDFRSQYSGGVSVVKRINFSWTDGRDVHYPTVDPNSAHVESLGREKAPPNFFKPTQRFGAEIMLPKTPHEMSECLGPTLV